MGGTVREEAVGVPEGVWAKPVVRTPLASPRENGQNRVEDALGKARDRLR